MTHSCLLSPVPFPLQEGGREGGLDSAQVRNWLIALGWGRRSSAVPASLASRPRAQSHVILMLPFLLPPPPLGLESTAHFMMLRLQVPLTSLPPSPC